MASADEIRAGLLSKRSKVPESEDLLSSGSTVLNLACSGRKSGAFRKGGYYFFVGDSSSGKSFVTRTMFAEACLDKRFKGYDLIDDDVENGANMDFASFFGKAMADRVQKRASRNLEDFYDHLLGLKKPFVYLLDSMDALKPAADLDKMEEDKKARAKGKETKGSYGMAKAKLNSNFMGEVNRKLKESGSILMVIGQTRDNIGLDAMFNPKTRGGGNALTFYAQLELWTSIRERLKSKKILGKERRTGIVVKVHVKKNRQTGRDRQVEVPLYIASGLADVDGNVRYLVQEGYWKVSDGKVDATDFDEKLPVEELVKFVEDNDAEDMLADVVQSVWDRIDAEAAVVRKSKYV